MPGETRPARPARWLAEALDTGVTISDSMPVRGLNVVYFENPESITKTILSIVSEVSAMLVASTTLREPGGVASNIFDCMSEGREE